MWSQKNVMILNGKRPQGKSLGPWKCQQWSKKAIKCMGTLREALCKVCKSEYAYHGEKPVSREMCSPFKAVFTLQSHGHQKINLVLMLTYLKQSAWRVVQRRKVSPLPEWLYVIYTQLPWRKGWAPLWTTVGWVYHVPSATHNAEVARRKLPAENY